MSGGSGRDVARLKGLLAAFAEVRLLVVGDALLDEYLWGDAVRVSPEAPVPIVSVERESLVLGGAGNVARNVIALGGRCALCAAVGDDADAEQMRKLVEALGVDSSDLVGVPGRKTTRKTRVVARSQQVVRYDREDLEPIPAPARQRVREVVAQRLPSVDGVVFEDYGKGLLEPEFVRALMRDCLEAGRPVIVDPKMELAAFRGATLTKPNLREAEALTGLCAEEPGGLDELARVLRGRLGGGRLAITRGGAGMTIFEDDGAGVPVRTVHRPVFDVQGAGDTTAAALALAECAGASLLDAAIIANAAAGVVVGKVGTATATPSEVSARLPEALGAAEDRS